SAAACPSLTDPSSPKVFSFSVDRAGPVRRWFDQLDQNAAGVLRMDKIDPAPAGAAARCVVEQPQAALAQRRAHMIDVTHPVGQLLQPGARAVDELGDRRLRAGDRMSTRL